MSLLITLESCLKKNKRELFSSLYMLRDRRKENLGDGSFAFWTYPHGLEVFNILNPLYLAGVDDFGKIAVHDYILVRDGFCSLVDFFYRFSRPGGCKTVFLIHERLSCVVPETWKKNVLTYSIQRKFEREGNKELPQSFYLCILNFDWKTNSQSLQQEVAQFRKYYGKDFEQIKFKIGIFHRGQPCCDHWKKTSSSMPVLVKEVCAEFGLDSTFYTWEEMVEGRDFHQSCYHYIAEKYFVHAYSYIDHFFLSRRCVCHLVIDLLEAKRESLLLICFQTMIFISMNSNINLVTYGQS